MTTATIPLQGGMTDIIIEDHGLLGRVQKCSLIIEATEDNVVAYSSFEQLRHQGLTPQRVEFYATDRYRLFENTDCYKSWCLERVKFDDQKDRVVLNNGDRIDIELPIETFSNVPLGFFHHVRFYFPTTRFTDRKFYLYIECDDYYPQQKLTLKRDSVSHTCASSDQLVTGYYLVNSYFSDMHLYPIDQLEFTFVIGMDVGMKRVDIVGMKDILSIPTTSSYDNEKQLLTVTVDCQGKKLPNWVNFIVFTPVRHTASSQRVLYTIRWSNTLEVDQGKVIRHLGNL